MNRKPCMPKREAGGTTHLRAFSEIEGPAAEPSTFSFIRSRHPCFRNGISQLTKEFMRGNCPIPAPLPARIKSGFGIGHERDIGRHEHVLSIIMKPSGCLDAA